MRIDFPDEFEATGTSPITVTGCTVSTSVTSSTCTTSVTADLVMFTFPFEITAGTAFDIVLSGITNPLA